MASCKHTCQYLLILGQMEHYEPKLGTCRMFPIHYCIHTVCLCVQDAFSLLAYSDPWNCPVGQQLDPTQRESLCSTLNSAILGNKHTPIHYIDIYTEREREINISVRKTNINVDVCILRHGFIFHIKEQTCFHLLITVFFYRVPKSAQAASTDASARTGHRVCSAHGAGSLWFLLLCQSRQLFALAQVKVSICVTSK